LPATADFQPTLEDATLRLRPLAVDDWNALYAVASDAEVWAGHPAHDRWQEAVFRRFFEEALASGGALVVIDRASGAIIGSSRYDLTYCEPGELEIGWTFLARSHWGGGANGAMKRLMVNHALASFDAVIFRIAESNIRSRRAMEKIGGRLTGRTQVMAVGERQVVHLIYVIETPLR
jgi:N-acetyltransferase